MRRISPAPLGLRSITPNLSAEGGLDALEFYKRASGARELAREATPDGKLVHGLLRTGDSILMLYDAFPASVMASPKSLGRSIVAIRDYSRDADAHWARAVASGRRRSDAPRRRGDERRRSEGG